MGATRRNLQAQPKILKKLSDHQIYQTKKKIFLKKNYVSYLESVKEPKNSYGNYPMEFAGSTKNPKKMISSVDRAFRVQFFSP
jgi:ABC-type oligopeptide transport system ATPase subunit